MLDRCRCCGVSLRGSDHCWKCGCEEFEERCEWDQPHFMFQLAERVRDIESLMAQQDEVENDG